jgi:hypothetical protein
VVTTASCAGEQAAKMMSASARMIIRFIYYRFPHDLAEL